MRRAKNKRYVEYQIVIAPDSRTGSQKSCFTAFVPALGIADDGDSVEEAFQNIRELITFHLKSLRKEKQPLPGEPVSGGFITTARIAVPA
ncbi:MAG: type II toxin-antitoxin system HicB family antitoxin [Candidatus Sungbacteria bacterium]|nr:type II toxin-antitoxin system HicB family antitoxin [Candidatus Sungbacteria bacterium]